MTLRRSLFLAFLLTMLFVSGCATADPNTQSRSTMLSEINAEPQGDYFIARRYYKVDYKFWGYIRKPGESWAAARMVMLNEQEKLAPDRAQNHIGSDNGYEYKLYGNFSDQTVYEPASNGFYPEFTLKNYELLNVSPLPIYSTPGALDPSRRVIIKPQ